MRLGVLGPLMVTADDGSLLSVAARKERAVLTVLALRADSAVQPGDLIGAVWGQNRPRSASKTVQTYISALRRLLPTGTIATDDSGYRLNIEPDQVDVIRFENLLQSGAEAAHGTDPGRAVSLLTEAMNLWRGEPLVDLAEEARMMDVVRLTELRHVGEEDLVDVRLRLGEHAVLVARLEGAVVDEPLRERRWMQLMLALYRSGRQADALRAYQRLRTVLGDELGLEPGQQVRDLERRIVMQDPTLQAHASNRGPPAGLLVPSEPVKARLGLDQALPVEPSTFVGREAELARVRELISSHRLVTLTGTGGSGKTRLAVEISAQMAETFADGVWFVDLAPLTDPEAVNGRVGKVLRRRSGSDCEATEDVIDLVGSRRLLLLLDNCEHVIGACAKLTEAVLRACPGARVLATSREPLAVAGEQLMAVPTLTVPPQGACSVHDLEGCAAVELFVDRARSQTPDFGVNGSNAREVGALCRLLDGMPLAIELAAAHAASMSVGELVARLDWRFRILAGGRRNALPRQRSLWATVDWSYQLLHPTEQALLRRLAVFRGGFSLPAAEAVGGFGDLDPFEVAALLSSLVNKSLVNMEQNDNGSRYRFLETIRQYARERLDATGSGSESEAAHAAHASYFASWAQRYGPDLDRPRHYVYDSAIATDFDNLSLALEHLADTSRVEELLAAAAGLRRWLWHNRVVLKPTVVAAISSGAPDVALPTRIGALCAASGLYIRNDLPRAYESAVEAVRLARLSGDDQLLAQADNALGTTAVALGVNDQARQAVDEAVALNRATGRWVDLGECLILRATYLRAVGQLPAAAAAAIEAIHLGSSMEDPRLEAEAHLAHAQVSDKRGDLDQAILHLNKAVGLFVVLGEPTDILRYNIAIVHLRQHRYHEAADALVSGFQTACRRSWSTLLLEASVALALCADATGNPEAAAVLSGFGDGLSNTIQLKWEAFSTLDVCEVAGLRQRLRADWASCYRAGRSMTAGDALDYVLDNFEPGGQKMAAPVHDRPQG